MAAKILSINQDTGESASLPSLFLKEFLLLWHWRTFRQRLRQGANRMAARQSPTVAVNGSAAAPAVIAGDDGVVCDGGVLVWNVGRRDARLADGGADAV